MASIKQFVTENKVRMTAERVDSNPSNPDWRDADHWRCTLRVGMKRLTVYFSKGYGHKGAEPKVAEVLDCLANDSSSVANANGFEDWARDFGYNTDSREAERTYREIERMGEKLAKLLGDTSYHELLWNTERE